MLEGSHYQRGVVQESISNVDEYIQIEIRQKREIAQPRKVYFQALRNITRMCRSV